METSKYHAIIEELVKNHRKYSGLEHMLTDIIQTVYEKAEPVICSASDESSVEKYLVKLVSVTILTMSKQQASIAKPCTDNENINICNDTPSVETDAQIKIEEDINNNDNDENIEKENTLQLDFEQPEEPSIDNEEQASEDILDDNSNQIETTDINGEIIDNLFDVETINETDNYDENILNNEDAQKAETNNTQDNDSYRDIQPNKELIDKMINNPEETLSLDDTAETIDNLFESVNDENDDTTECDISTEIVSDELEETAEDYSLELYNTENESDFLLENGDTDKIYSLDTDNTEYSSQEPIELDESEPVNTAEFLSIENDTNEQETVPLNTDNDDIMGSPNLLETSPLDNDFNNCEIDTDSCLSLDDTQQEELDLYEEDILVDNTITHTDIDSNLNNTESEDLLSFDDSSSTQEISYEDNDTYETETSDKNLTNEDSSLNTELNQVIIDKIYNRIYELNESFPNLHIYDIFEYKYLQKYSILEITTMLNIDEYSVVNALNKIITIVEDL